VEIDYERNMESDPPYDCAFVTLDPTPTVMNDRDHTFTPTPTAYNTEYDNDLSFVPTPTANIDDAYNNAEQDDVGPSIGAHAWFDISTRCIYSYICLHKSMYEYLLHHDSYKWMLIWPRQNQRQQADLCTGLYFLFTWISAVYLCSVLDFKI